MFQTTNQYPVAIYKKYLGINLTGCVGLWKTGIWGFPQLGYPKMVGFNGKSY